MDFYSTNAAWMQLTSFAWIIIGEFLIKSGMNKVQFVGILEPRRRRALSISGIEITVINTFTTPTTAEATTESSAD
jgi:hypothetical protein